MMNSSGGESFENTDLVDRNVGLDDSPAPRPSQHEGTVIFPSISGSLASLS